MARDVHANRPEVVAQYPLHHALVTGVEAHRVFQALHDELALLVFAETTVFLRVVVVSRYDRGVVMLVQRFNANSFGAVERQLYLLHASVDCREAKFDEPPPFDRLVQVDMDELEIAVE